MTFERPSAPSRQARLTISGDVEHQRVRVATRILSSAQRMTRMVADLPHKNTLVKALGERAVSFTGLSVSLDALNALKTL